MPHFLPPRRSSVLPRLFWPARCLCSCLLWPATYRCTFRCGLVFQPWAARDTFLPCPPGSPLVTRHSRFVHGLRIRCFVRPKSWCPVRSGRSEEHTSELQSLMRISYAVFCLKKKKHHPSSCNTVQSNHNYTSNTS